MLTYGDHSDFTLLYCIFNKNIQPLRENKKHSWNRGAWAASAFVQYKLLFDLHNIYKSRFAFDTLCNLSKTLNCVALRKPVDLSRRTRTEYRKDLEPPCSRRCVKNFCMYSSLWELTLMLFEHVQHVQHLTMVKSQHKSEVVKCNMTQFLKHIMCFSVLPVTFSLWLPFRESSNPPPPMTTIHFQQ